MKRIVSACLVGLMIVVSSVQPAWASQIEPVTESVLADTGEIEEEIVSNDTVAIPDENNFEESEPSDLEIDGSETAESEINGSETVESEIEESETVESEIEESEIEESEIGESELTESETAESENETTEENEETEEETEDLELQASGSLYGITWNVQTINGKQRLTIGGNYNGPDEYSWCIQIGRSNFPWYAYRNSVTEVVFNSNALEYVYESLADFKNLSHIVINSGHMCWEGHIPFTGSHGYPNIKTMGVIGSGCHLEYNPNTTYFGDGAFSNFKYLTTVNYVTYAEEGDIPPSLFEGCSRLENVTLSGNITAISYDAFHGCNSLKQVIMPDTVEYIGASAFEGCTSLKNIQLSNNLIEIGGDAFKNTGITYLTLPASFAMSDYQSSFCSSSCTIICKNSAGRRYAQRFGNPYLTYDYVNDSVKPFVTRMYNYCLDRQPDTTGFNKYVEALSNGGMNGIQLAYNFVFSPEFKNKNLCNEDFVEYMYRVFIGRNSDSAGKKSWVAQLESGVTREAIFNGFAGSNEFNQLCRQYGINRGAMIAIPKYGTVPTGACSVCGKLDGVTQFVTRLYQYCLGRKPDAAGLSSWCNKLRTHQITGYQAVHGFVFSNEFKAKNYNNTEFVRQLYRICFDRNADTAGLNSWVSKLNSGTSRLSVVLGFAGSQEFIKLCNKYSITPK